MSRAAVRMTAEHFAADETTVRDALRAGPKHYLSLPELTGLSLARVSCALVSLGVSRLVTKIHHGGVYTLTAEGYR